MDSLHTTAWKPSSWYCFAPSLPKDELTPFKQWSRFETPNANSREEVQVTFQMAIRYVSGANCPQE